MKFFCDKSQLISAISTAALTVAQRSTIPALEGICLQAGMTLTLTGYNMETAISVEVPAEITEPGACVMPSPLFGEIIRKLPADDVSVTVDDKLKVSIRSGISFFQIMAISAEDYPELPEVDTTDAVSLPQKTLRSMISGASFCVSTSQARPILTGCAFELEQQELTVVSVDGYRLAMRQEQVENPEGHAMKFVIPAAGLREVERILKDSDDPVSFTLGSKHILFEIGAVRLICRLLDGAFMDWRRVIPREQPIRLTVNVRELTGCVERMSLITTEKIKNPVRCRFSKDEADFRTSASVGMAHEVCAIAGDGNGLEIGFNCKFLLDALKAVSTPEVCLELSNGLSPMVMVPCEGPQRYLYMILPVRLKAEGAE